MILTMGGPPGSGKTTVARILSERLKLELVVIGEIFRGMARERGVSLARFGEMASKDHSIDIELDKRTLDRARAGNLILEGRLAGVMLHKNKIEAFKIWLDADIKERARRIAGRDGGKLDEVLLRIKEREDCENRRYRAIYGLNPAESQIYDLVIDSTHLSPDRIVEKILKALGV